MSRNFSLNASSIFTFKSKLGFGSSDDIAQIISEVEEIKYQLYKNFSKYFMADFYRNVNRTICNIPSYKKEGPFARTNLENMILCQM